MQSLFLLEPQYRERVWGGQRLKANDPPIGEAWIAFADSRVQAGSHAGQTIAELTAIYGPELLGAEVTARFGLRFPLLIKLLDCADWLSVQVHPNDEQAARMVGPKESGKTEAWHFLEVERGATIFAGVKAGTTSETLAKAIREQNIINVAQQQVVQTGETYLLPAGTLHALGPGLLLYEVQQASDTTYRVYDWDRPASVARPLHVEESVAVTDPSRTPVLTPPSMVQGTAAVLGVSCPFFELLVLQIADLPFRGQTEGRAFDLLTATTGVVDVSCDSETIHLDRYETILVAGRTGPYEIHSANGMAELLLATIPSRRHLSQLNTMNAMNRSTLRKAN